jgi:AraC-like DNA-binding protein
MTATTDRRPAATSDLAELRARVAREARSEGRHESALPGVWFHRAERAIAFRRGRAPSLMLGVVVQGRKVARVAERELHYGARSYLIVTGALEFESRVVEASPARPYLSIGVQLPPELVVKTLLSLPEVAPGGAGDPEEAYVSRLDAALVATLCRLLRTLDDPAEQRVVAPLVLAELVFRLLRSDWAASIRRAAQRDGDQTRIAQAMEFMRGNLGRRLTVATIARQVAMSPSHFAHRFREIARMSPMHYLKHARMLEARLLLLHDGLRPGEAAGRVGYASPAHFHRDFKNSFALPPATYVRSFRGALAGGSQDPARGSQPAPSR